MIALENISVDQIRAEIAECVRFRASRRALCGNLKRVMDVGTPPPPKVSIEYGGSSRPSLTDHNTIVRI